jgi:hypothetical protein
VCGKIASSRNTGAQKLHSLHATEQRDRQKESPAKPGWSTFCLDQFASIASRDKLTRSLHFVNLLHQLTSSAHLASFAI